MLFPGTLLVKRYLAFGGLCRRGWWAGRSERVAGIEPQILHEEEIRAGDGNRTRDSSLEERDLTTKLRPRILVRSLDPAHDAAMERNSESIVASTVDPDVNSPVWQPPALLVRFVQSAVDLNTLKLFSWDAGETRPILDGGGR